MTVGMMRAGVLTVAMAALGLSAAACSKSGTSDGTIPFPVEDQIFFGSDGAYQLKILDYGGACALEQASDSHLAGSEYIEINYAGSAPPGIGTYAVPSQMAIELHARDASCNKVVDVAATSGTVTITSESATTLTGTFSADLPMYGTVGGAVSATFCNTDTSTGPSTCVAGSGG